MKIKVVLIQVVAIFGLVASGWSQTENDTTPAGIDVQFTTDVVSRYVWRGLEFGQAPSIQPGLSATWQGFTLGAWGAYKLNGEGAQETDFYLSKSFGPVTLAIWDYWSFYDTSAMDFFNYEEKTTAHLLEAQVLLSGGELLPFNLLGSYFFYGLDTTKSIYLELQYVKSFGETNFMAFAGYTPKGRYYGSGEGLVNLGIQLRRTVKVTETWNLPLSMSLVYNPDVKSMYLVAGFSL